VPVPLFPDGLPTLHGERVRLRPLRPEDDADLLRVFSDDAHLRYWSHGALDGLDAARRYREEIEAAVRDGASGKWAIADASDRLIGTVSLYAWRQQNRRGEIGYALSPDHAGRGLAREAVRTLLRFAFETLDLHRIEADVDPENGGSIRLLERLGFRYEGRLRERWFTFGSWKDSLVYGLLADDFVDPSPDP